MASTPVALTIAGSDSGGGAGIQADLKAFAACGVHGTSAITAITAQNTVGVSAVHPVPGEIVLEQVRAVVRDIGVDAVKVGMLGTVEVTRAVARALDELPPRTPVVVDPVMVAESGARCSTPRRRERCSRRSCRAPACSPRTCPRRACSLGSRRAGARAERRARRAEVEQLARAVLALGPQSVVLTGGHRTRAVDLFRTLRRQHRRCGADRDSRRAPRRGRGARLWLHALGGARRPARAGRDATAGRSHRAARAGEAVAHGLRDVGAGAGPVDVIGLAALAA